MFLGPLNNMTTIAATALAFHPNVQVLNHGARHLWEARGCNFLADFTEENFQYFCREAIEYSQTSGISGYPGGSIIVSHTFSNNDMVIRYMSRYGPNPVKEDVQCIVWKDPMELERYTTKNLIHYEKLFREDGDRLRFLLPIRNPLDTTMSMSRGDNWKQYEGKTNNLVGDLIDAVIQDIYRFLRLQREFPSRFFFFTQDNFPHILEDLAEFLDLDFDETWVQTCQEIWQPRPSYRVLPVMLDFYTMMVKMRFGGFPKVRDMLLEYGKVREGVEYRDP